VSGFPAVALGASSRTVFYGIRLATHFAEEQVMSKQNQSQFGILGDINPKPGTEEHVPSKSSLGFAQDQESMAGGSRHDRTEHAGSRDVTEGVTGGLGTETGGTRNYRQGTGATGGDIGTRPE
jgi:hypothetical protein